MLKHITVRYMQSTLDIGIKYGRHVLYAYRVIQNRRQLLITYTTKGFAR